MSPTWQGPPPPERPAISARGWLRVVLRGVPMAFLVFGGLLLTLLIRLAERPLHGLHRPWTPTLTVFVCRNALRILGLRLVQRGQPMTGSGVVVANHSSWLDIFTLNAGKRIYFVSKSEVADWPGIGWLARATGTVFIERDPRQAAQQTETIRDRLLAGHKLLFFPEGTSTDGTVVLPFKPTLFQAFFDPGLREEISVQPVSLRYVPPEGADPRFYGWYGDMTFGGHLLLMLSAPRHGRVIVRYHAPVPVRGAPDRKSLAKSCETAVRAGFEADPDVVDAQVAG
ncbi:lysophospholipid acyltransferase family protein [Sulfitobacter sp. D35]|uniref:lysophospholipid acyltransferase family protein n=1 Tax=Sulfitobacter sp. D35 TaxID=3083252 RepID=UPI00296F709C|nr:lysophospholipid acyltransferase family protein [Sulfitobacter sp. D35]MDW4496542.1 lysophospholipid acyltransferase family protein [Sulfitobacter sp. D35]